MAELMLSHAGVTLRPGAARARFSLRCAPADAALARGALGLELPLRPLTSTADGARAALWLGPDEWLILAEETAADTLPDAFAAAFTDTPFSLVEISARQVAFMLEGEQAGAVLNEGCPLDLADAAFGAGHCARTVFGKVEIVLWRPGAAPAWHVEVWRSFAPHLQAHLHEALQDL